VLPLTVGGTTLGQFYGGKVMGGGLTLEFIYGITAYYLSGMFKGSGSIALKGALICTAAVCLLLPILPNYQNQLGHLMPKGLYYGIPAFGLVLSAVGLTRIGLDSRSSFLILLGDSSYALYLTHLFVIYAQNRLFAKKIHWVSAQTPVGCVIALILCSAVSIALYLYIEKPILKFLTGRFCTPAPSTRAANSAISPVQADGPSLGSEERVASNP